MKSPPMTNPTLNEFQNAKMLLPVKYVAERKKRLGGHLKRLGEGSSYRTSMGEVGTQKIVQQKSFLSCFFS
jgi:hypothetical protein